MPLRWKSQRKTLFCLCHIGRFIFLFVTYGGPLLQDPVIQDSNLASIVWVLPGVTSPKTDFLMAIEPPHDKTNKMAVRPAKTQTSLGICPVWSESSLFAWRKLGSFATH